MKVHVAEPSNVQLIDAGNFKDFSVVASMSSRARVGAILERAGAGLVRGEYAWIDEAWLRGRGVGLGEHVTEFDGMLAFARNRGWIDPHGRIRAHITWS